MNKKTWILAGSAVVVLVAALAWAFAPRPLPVETAQARRASFETGIDEEGRTRLLERYVVSAPLAGRLGRIALREGDAVEAGAVVAQLTPAMSPLLDERTQREQGARVAAAEASLQRAGTRIEASRVALELARNELRRTEQLAGQGFVAPTKVDTDRLAVQAAQKELQTAVEGRHVAEHELEQARAALASLRGGTGAAFAVRAPVAGRVLKVHHPSEGTVALGTPLLDLGDTARIEVLAELLTTDALQVRTGSPVRIERWGGPGVLEGVVRLVEPAAFTKVSALGVEEQRVNVLADITSPRERWQALGDGFRVGVRIVTQSVSDVLVVPVSAVFPLPRDDAAPGRADDRPQRMGAFVVEGGRARQRELQVAGRNGTQAWVREGLKEGETVIVYPGNAVADGARVRARGS